MKSIGPELKLVRTSYGGGNLWAIFCSIFCREQPSRALVAHDVFTIARSISIAAHQHPRFLNLLATWCSVLALLLYFSQPWMDMCTPPASRSGYQPASQASLSKRYINLQPPTNQANVIETMFVLSEGATSIGATPDYVLVSTVQQCLNANPARRQRDVFCPS